MKIDLLNSKNNDYNCKWSLLSTGHATSVFRQKETTGDIIRSEFPSLTVNFASCFFQIPEMQCLIFNRDGPLATSTGANSKSLLRKKRH